MTTQTPKPLPDDFQERCREATERIRTIKDDLLAAGLGREEAAHAILYAVVPGIVAAHCTTYTADRGEAAITKARAVEAPEPRRLRIEAHGATKTHVLARVVEQTHRGGDFTPGGSEWRPPSGRCLKSVVHPDYDNSVDITCVRGSYTHMDDAEMKVPLDKWPSLLDAVDAYNKAFGGGGA